MTKNDDYYLGSRHDFERVLIHDVSTISTELLSNDLKKIIALLSKESNVDFSSIYCNVDDTNVVRLGIEFNQNEDEFPTVPADVKRVKTKITSNKNLTLMELEVEHDNDSQAFVKLLSVAVDNIQDKKFKTLLNVSWSDMMTKDGLGQLSFLKLLFRST
jgi:hypothetical protein